MSFNIAPSYDRQVPFEGRLSLKIDCIVSKESPKVVVGFWAVDY